MLDLALHTLAAILITLLALLMPYSWDQWALAFSGSLVWFIREAYQNNNKWGNWISTWSNQKKIEAIAPTIAGLVTAWFI